MMALDSKDASRAAVASRMYKRQEVADTRDDISKMMDSSRQSGEQKFGLLALRSWQHLLGN